MPAKKSEKSVEKAILTFLNSLPDCHAIKVHQDIYQSGEPDISGCIRGRGFRIEVKKPEDSYGVTKLQAKSLRDWAAAGAVTGVVTSLREVQELLVDYLD